MPDKKARKTFFLLLESLSLKNLPRTGWVNAKAPRESVAEHTYGACLIALVLARMEGMGGKGESALLRRVLLHDLHEARIGDLTPGQKAKQKPDEKKVEREMLGKTHLEKEIALLADDKLAVLAKDADRLDMLLRAVENSNAGNRNMRRFIGAALGQIKSKSGKKLAKMALEKLEK
ncbi:TPA: HD domain-containing protein [Candidatus Micrarchaeota archaeon]|nr:HD domain-containing protein [Candidatus Micrarchaeota archaeon]HIH30351.1 HD domain-containing protein [Candidatus Micrarchaeota archaeon]